MTMQLWCSILKHILCIALLKTKVEVTLIFTMDYKIYIFPTDDELEWLSYPDNDIDWDSLIEFYIKKTHMIMII
jgi:hypothetical protein